MDYGQATLRSSAALVLTGALCLHFLLTGYFSFTNYPRHGRLAAASEYYTVPAFYQNWSLFAPDLPAYDVQLEYRAAHRGNWRPWTDAGQGTFPAERIEQSYSTALGREVLLNLYRSGDKTQFDRIVESSAYRQATLFAARLDDGLTGDSLQLRLKFRFTPEPGKAYTFQLSELEFPPFSHDAAP
jgi:hypothetical protein